MASRADIEYASPKVAPELFDRFKAIDNEIEYRTIYMALSSQVHNDAEDLLNYWTALVVVPREMRHLQKETNEAFAFHVAAVALLDLAEAATVFLAKYDGFELSSEWKTLRGEFVAVLKHYAGILAALQGPSFACPNPAPLGTGQ